MNLNLPKEVQEILSTFTKANFQIYIVGGAVRDLLLVREVKDWDFTTDAKPEEILKLYPNGFYDNKFVTVGIPIKDEKADAPEKPARQDPESLQVFEITTMRKEGNYQDHRHPVEVSWTGKIEEDLARRDFTINAFAMDKDLKITDPFNGQGDLKNKFIKTVGDPNQRFKEDALRLMRAIRITTQLDFKIEEDTFRAIKQNAKLISDIAYERIRDEFFKLLSAPNAYQGIIYLKETGILEIILPEVTKCEGLIQEGPKHDRVYEIEDHLFRSMRETPSSDPLVKFAALLHDIGKADTYAKDESGNVTFYNHEVAGAELSKNIATRFNLSNKQADKLYRLIRWHMFSMNENQTDAAIRRFIKNVGKENIEDIMAIRVGDRLGGDTSKPVSWRMEKFQEKIKQVLVKPFSITDLKINGNDVMKILNLKPSRKVGEILDKLFQEVLDDSSKNTQEYLFKRVKLL